MEQKGSFYNRTAQQSQDQQPKTAQAPLRATKINKPTEILKLSQRVRNISIPLNSRRLSCTQQLKSSLSSAGQMADTDDRLRRWSVQICIGVCQIRQAQSPRSNIEHGHNCAFSDAFLNGTAGDKLCFEYNQKQGKLTVATKKGDRYEIRVGMEGENTQAYAYLKDIGDSAVLID